MSSRTHHVFLIPGFLGIENLGEVVYFSHVRELLIALFNERGVDVQIHAVRNFATASIRKRTLRLLETVATRTTSADDPVHLIGHSTGGLDARLLCTPGTSLGGRLDAEAIATRVRSIVTIACPHRGTPLASFFTTRLGAQLLSLLSLGTIYLLRYGRLPISVVVRLGAVLVRAHSRLGHLEHTVADQLFEQLLGDFSAERRDELNLLFKDMAGDVGLMPQLMPESMDMFDAAVGDRDAIRCASVITSVKPGSLHSVFQLGLDPYAQATHALFEGVARLTAEMDQHYLPQLTAAQTASLQRVLGKLPTAKDNDGIVPVLSQVWGELIHVARADHFDVIGHFADPKLDPPHYDWLASGSGFDRTAFERLWRDVVGFICTERSAP